MGAQTFILTGHVLSKVSLKDRFWHCVDGAGQTQIGFNISPNSMMIYRTLLPISADCSISNLYGLHLEVEPIVATVHGA